MPYESLILRMLISAPGDVDPEDMRTVHRTINQWNFQTGRDTKPMSVTFLPVSWSDHAASEFGIRPQESLNRQLVDRCDLALAMFANRLGTHTGDYVSGTVEEMEKMHAAGKRVSIARSTAPWNASGAKAVEQRLALEQYLDSVSQTILYMNYSTGEQLASIVRNTLHAETYQRTRSEDAKKWEERHRPAPVAQLAIWPTVDRELRTSTDNRGNVKTSIYRYLVLTNKTGGVARDVRFRYETEDGGVSSFDLGNRNHGVIPRMPPDAEERFPIQSTLGTDSQALCIVTWRDDNTGREHETRATVRKG